MTKPINHEALLVSAVLNEADAGAAKDYGVLPEHFISWRESYEWILNYQVQYVACPTVTAFRTTFPDFPFSEDSYEARWPAHEVKKAFSARDLARRSIKAATLLTKGDVDGAYALFDGLTSVATPEKPVNVLVDHCYLDDYQSTDEVRVGMPWPTLQRITSGMGPGELWYIAARQGNGKSSYLIDIAVEAAMEGRRVCFYSLEMTKRQVQVRAHAAMAHRLGIKVSSHEMLHRQFDHLKYKRLLHEIEDRVTGELMVHEASMGRVTPSAISARSNDYDLHIVDYVGLMHTDSGAGAISDWRAIAEISNSLKSVALGKGTRIIGASQINREGDGPGWRPPKLKFLAQSDHLGNDGDVVVTMKRFGDGAGVFSVEKNRHGISQNHFFTNFGADLGDFSEISRDRADEIKAEGEDEEDY